MTPAQKVDRRPYVQSQSSDIIRLRQSLNVHSHSVVSRKDKSTIHLFILSTF